MTKGAIKYGTLWLMPGSVAHKLHSEGKITALIEHLKEVEGRYKKLTGVKT